MKFAHVRSFVLSHASRCTLALVALAASTLSTPAHAGGRECLLASQGDSDVATIQNFVDEALEASIVAVVRGESADASLAELSDLVALESQIVVYTEAECLVLQRLQAEIEDLRGRAQRWMAREIDLYQLRQEILLSRLERAVSAQEALWSMGLVDDSIARATIEALTADAFDAMTTPHFAQIRARLAGAIELASKTAMNEIVRLQSVHHFYADLYAARWMAAADRLGANQLDDVVTFRDGQRMNDATVDLFTLVTQPTPYACGS